MNTKTIFYLAFFSFYFFILFLTEPICQIIYYQTEGRLTQEGEIIRGGGISLIVSGPEKIIKNSPAKFVIEIKPGKSWTNKSGAFAKPREILGLGMSQMMIWGNDMQLKLKNPILNIAGKTVLHELLIAQIPLGSDVLPSIAGMLVDTYLRAVNFNHKKKFTSKYVGMKPNWDGSSEYLKVVLGGAGLNDISQANNIKLEFDVIFSRFGNLPLLIIPDFRAEALATTKNNMITSTFPTMFEYREGVLLNIQVSDESYDGFSEFCGSFTKSLKEKDFQFLNSLISFPFIFAPPRQDMVSYVIEKDLFYEFFEAIITDEILSCLPESCELKLDAGFKNLKDIFEYELLPWEVRYQDFIKIKANPYFGWPYGKSSKLFEEKNRLDKKSQVYQLTIDLKDHINITLLDKAYELSDGEGWLVSFLFAKDIDGNLKMFYLNHSWVIYP